MTLAAMEKVDLVVVGAGWYTSHHGGITLTVVLRRMVWIVCRKDLH
jgi:hypothetical protein